MKKIIILIFGILIVILAVYIFFYDSLPPRTPQKIARLISGLHVPRDARVEKYEEQWNAFNGNGYSLIILSLEKEAFNKIYNRAKSLNYQELPIKEVLNGPINSFLPKKSNGIYEVQFSNKENMSYSISLLNNVDNTLLIYVASN
ncbi:hypothetical protein [Algoriphagus confluentis]|uniref:Uncharacterized protein n=1 Tax=Algoriphagus confluentis TaxID=1697556 RepID=A0ABQ6PRP3_9BACT|nr:hypothetical protein Aconfl_32710 [Algoriphagus confluentis]